MQLSEIVGEEILVSVTTHHGFRRVKLLGVEAGGIWIESQLLTNAILRGIGEATSLRTPILFLPYHRVSEIVHSIDVPVLGEKAFGV